MKFRVLLAAALLVGFSFGQPVGAEFVSWQDKNYDFSRVKTVYVAATDARPAEIYDPLKEKILGEELNNKLASVKSLSFIFEEIPIEDEEPDFEPGLPTAPKEEASPVRDADVTEESAAKETVSATPAPEKSTKKKIPQEAVASGADVYLRPVIRIYEVTEELIPAHTEWRTRQIDRSWKDKDGNWHKDYQTITYPVHVPDMYIDHAYISCEFEMYDIKTGKLIAGSEDSRDRSGEDNPLDMYRRIVERFVKNLKKWGVKNS